MNPDLFDEKRRNSIQRSHAEVQLTLAAAQEGENRPAEELLYELRVHRIELETQNEELRRAQAALEESRDRYLDLYAFAPVGYLTLSREGFIDEINLTGASFLGAERKKLLHRRFDAFVAPEDHDRWQRQFVSMIQHGVGRQKFELELKRANGTVFYGRLDCLLVELDNAPLVVRVTLSDIDELKRSEITLRADNERLNLLLASTAAAIYTVDEKGLCTFANPACAKLLGYANPEELLGQDMHSLVHQRHEDGSAYPLEECLVHNVTHSTQPASLHEDRFRRADGSSFPVEVSASPMQRDGVIVGAVVNFNDITARKQA